MIKRMLDLYCGAGGAAMGYYRAFGPDVEIVGVDIKPQPRYPFIFIQADALEFMRDGRGDGFDFYHASPPCQGYSRMRHLSWLKGRKWPLLIDETKDLLQATGKPWVIENVSDAPLAGGTLCGAAIGLSLLRHRRFESNFLLLFPPCPGHPTLHHGSANMRKYGQGAGVMGIADGQDPGHAMGIDWMTGRELRQAIPPAYTEWIGRQILEIQDR